MKQRILVLSISTYKVPDQTTPGQINQGASIEIMYNDGVNDVTSYGSKLGYFTTKQKIDLAEDLPLITHVPGVYECDVKMKTNPKDRSTQAVATGFKLIAPLSVNDDCPTFFEVKGGIK